VETTGKEFVDFWSWASGKGLMNKNTAQSLATAVKRVISIDEGWETIDVRTMNIDEILLRFKNIRNKDFTPDSLQVYERRFKRALKLFLQYQQSPSTWKYPSKTDAGRKQSNFKKETTQFKETSVNSLNIQTASNIPMVDYPYPLRDNCIIRLKLPIDLKTADIDRLVSFLRTLAVDSNQ
jgi:hypothetical protein